MGAESSDEGELEGRAAALATPRARDKTRVSCMMVGVLMRGALICRGLEGAAARRGDKGVGERGIVPSQVRRDSTFE